MVARYCIIWYEVGRVARCWRSSLGFYEDVLKATRSGVWRSNGICGGDDRWMKSDGRGRSLRGNQDGSWGRPHVMRL